MNTNQSLPTHKDKIQARHKLILFVLAFSMIPLFFVSRNLLTGFMQTKDRNEKKMTKESFKNEPIEIISLESSGKRLKLDEKFIQEEDWLKDFTIEFKNISGKPITYVSVVIGFPETDSTGSRMVYFLKYGVNPLIRTNITDKPGLLPPNATTELKLSAEKYTNLKNFLATRQHLLKDLTEAHLTIMAVYFDDETHWSAGTLFRPDLNNPGKFLPVNDPQEDEK